METYKIFEIFKSEATNNDFNFCILSVYRRKHCNQVNKGISISYFNYSFKPGYYK